MKNEMMEMSPLELSRTEGGSWILVAALIIAGVAIYEWLSDGNGLFDEP